MCRSNCSGRYIKWAGPLLDYLFWSQWTASILRNISLTLFLGGGLYSRRLIFETKFGLLSRRAYIRGVLYSEGAYILVDIFLILQYFIQQRKIARFDVQNLSNEIQATFITLKQKVFQWQIFWHKTENLHNILERDFKQNLWIKEK